MENILLIEDDKNIIELVKYHFEKEGFRVIAKMTGEQGLEQIFKQKPALVILDLMLPEINGLDLCKILKQNPATACLPIIILTAKSEEADIILGLELGADDYITKPFSPRELVARVRAVLRATKEKSEDEILKAGALEIHTHKHTVTLKEKTVPLSSKEYGILKALMEADGRVLERNHLLKKVWGHDAPVHTDTRSLDVHIRHLRQKLKSESRRIVTVKNAGYRFDFED